MATGQSFNYAIFDADEDELLGCVYIDPRAQPGASGATVSWWVVDHARRQPARGGTGRACAPVAFAGVTLSRGLVRRRGPMRRSWSSSIGWALCFSRPMRESGAQRRSRTPDLSASIPPGRLETTQER